MTRARDEQARPPTRPDLLARIAALGIRDKELLARARVAPAFLSKARSGACGDSKASASWSKVETAITALEVERAAVAPPPPITPPSPTATSSPTTSPPAAPSAAPITMPRRPSPPAEPAASPVHIEGVDLPAELAGFIGQVRAARTPDELAGLQRRVAELVALGPLRGGITPDVARVLIQCVQEQRQLLRAQREAEERARSGQLRIEIVYRNEWRPKAEGESEAARAARVKAAGGSSSS